MEFREFRAFKLNVGIATNNEAEYKAVLAAMWFARAQGIRDLEIRSDSQLVVNQVLGRFEVRCPALVPLCAMVRDMRLEFEHCDLVHVPRRENRRADELANEGVYEQ